MDMFDEDRSFEDTKGIINGVLHALNETPPAQHYYDCMAEQGTLAGQQAASGPHDQHGYDDALQHAMSAGVCNYESFVPHEGFSLPEASSAPGVALELMLAPSTVNAGETEYFHGIENFQQGWNHGYFDQQLQSHFDVDWGHQQHPEPPAPAPHVFDAFNSLAEHGGTFDSGSVGHGGGHDAGAVGHAVDHDSGSGSGSHGGGSHDSGGGSHGDPGAGGL